MDPFVILIVLALLFAVLSLWPAAANWPLLSVSVILLTIAVLIGPHAARLR